MTARTIESNVMSRAITGNYASVNGLKIYYEIHDTHKTSQPPLVLLHGGLGGASMFAQLLPDISQARKVIAIDLQAHGHTADIDRPLSFAGMADDIAALIKNLGFEKTDLLGYSLGGGVALQTAIRHPDVVHKLVLVSTPSKRDGWYPEVLAGMAAMNAEAAQAMIASPMHEAYITNTSRPEDWPVLVTKVGQLLKQDYDWSRDVAAIKAPTLIIFGDADSVRLVHVVELFGLLGGGKVDAGWDGSGMSKSRLAILPATTHYNIFYSPMLAPTVIPFLDAPMPE